MNLRKLLGFCEHQWEVKDSMEQIRFMFNLDGSINDKSRHKLGIYYIMRCSKCGWIKSTKLL